MNENECHDYIVSIINKFEKKHAAFASVSREKRDQVLKRGSNLAQDSKTPPVGAYSVKFGAIDKCRSSALMSPKKRDHSPKNKSPKARDSKNIDPSPKDFSAVKSQRLQVADYLANLSKGGRSI